MSVTITRANVNELLDKRVIEVAMRSGKWWEIRRNGKTKTWKKDASRICIPFKYGFRGCSQITETDFREDGTLDPTQYRVRESYKG
jgi:hypothetical protein